MMGLVEPTPSPSPPILGLTSPRGTNQLPTPFSPHPTQPAMPLLPSPDISAPFRYGRVRVGPSSVLPRPSADEAAVAPHLRYLVMALGSTTLRYGTADEFQPRSKAMAVAYRAKGADGRKRRKTGEERKEANGGMDEMKDVSVDLPMKGEEKKEKPQSRVATSSAASRAGVAAQVAAWHEQAGEDFTVLNAEVIKRRVQPPPKPKFFDEYDPVPVYEEDGPTTTVTLAVDDTPWTNVDHEPSYITGNEALDLHPDDPYTIFFPMRRGRLNVSYTPFTGSVPASSPPCPNSSYTACLSAIEHLLADTLMNDFHIPSSSFHMYSLVLSLPPTLTYRNVYDIADICFSRLGLKELFVHHSPVLATYGCGLPTACVVHAGGQTIRVVCVDDGMEVSGSSVVLERGGDEVGEVMLAYMKHHDHYLQPALRQWEVHDSVWQWRQVQRAKDKVLTAALREFHYQWVEFREPTADGAVRVYRMNVSSAALCASRALFDPRLMRGGGGVYGTLWDVGSGVVLDVVMDDIVRQSVFYAFTAEYERTTEQQRRPVWEQVRKQAEGQAESTAAAPEASEEKKEEGGILDLMGERPKKKKKKRRDEPQEVEEAVDFALPTTNPALLNNQSSTSPIPTATSAASGSAAAVSPAASSAGPLSLAQAIAASINSVASISRRRRLCLSVVLTGGSFAMPHIADYATQLLAGQLPPLMLSTLTPMRDAGEEVQCVVGGKMVGIGSESWKGAVVVAGIRMEALGSGGKDKWMSREEWQRNPTRTLREKCPFVI